MSAINELSSFSGRHLVGFGMYGQATTGISDQYSYLFKGYEATTLERVSLHNVYLQVLIDNGYLGLFAYLAAVFMVILCLRKCSCESCNLKLIILCYLFLSGFTEPVPSIYNLTVFLIFIVISATRTHPPVESQNVIAAGRKTRIGKKPMTQYATNPD
jgi:hypothetical protein